jgi:hypothetical protein
VENYFNYFTEIEEHFQKRRGAGLLLSTLDWALIESWKEAGIPLAAVLRGIDAAFDRYDDRPSKTKKVNSLAYCAQEVLGAAEDLKEAAVGAANELAPSGAAPGQHGFDAATISSFLRRNAAAVERIAFEAAPAAKAVATEAARSLREIADQINPSGPRAPTQQASKLRLEDLERRLTVMEEKLFSALLASTPDEEILAVRTEADRDLAPYRSKMPAGQISQLQKQYVHKRVLEKHGVPRLSLFYM